ncbi:hypothetical protein ABFS82_08G195800 [Erythranthe guttata]
MENDDEDSYSVESRTTRKNSSEVWNFFQKVIDDGKQKAKCKRCGQLYVSSGTTNLKRHLESICPFRSGEDVVVDVHVIGLKLTIPKMKKSMRFFRQTSEN